MTASASSSGVEDINYSSIVRTCHSVALAKPYLETLGADGNDEVVAKVSRLYECPWPCTNSNPHTAVAEVAALLRLPRRGPAQRMKMHKWRFMQQSYADTRA